MGIRFSHGPTNLAIHAGNQHQDLGGQNRSSSFRMPLHYPKYTRSDYEQMPELQLDQLLRDYGLPIIGDSDEKRNFAIGAFLWSPVHQDCGSQNRSSSFRMPLHYPKYTNSDYEQMPEWQLDQLLRDYGMPVIGDSYEKRKFAIGAFLWSPEH